MQERKLLDVSSPDTLASVRDRAILSVGLQVGLRRTEIAGLSSDGLHQNRGYDAPWLTRKGCRQDVSAISLLTAQRIRAYLDLAGHGNDQAGPLFRSLRGNTKAYDLAGRLDPDVIDRLVRKYATEIGLPCGYSAHSIRATSSITALEDGAQFEDVQKVAGHRDPSTTKLYDHQGYSPEKTANFFAVY